jgi:hypothetical protein
MTTKADLRDAPQGSFLYCPICDGRFSATHGDYFMMADDAEFFCLHGDYDAGYRFDSWRTPMILCTEQREIIPVA